MRLTDHSVRTRLTVWYSAALTVILIILSVGIFLGVGLVLHRSVEVELDDATATIASIAEAQPSDLAHELEELEAFGVFHLFSVRDVDRGVVHQAQSWMEFGLDSVELQASGPAVHWEAEDGDSYYLRRVEVSSLERRLIVDLAVDGRMVDQAMRTLAWILMASFPVGLVLSVIGGTILGGRVLEPIADITHQLEKITAERLSKRIVTASPDDEYGRLAAATNEALGRLERSFDQLRRFTADVSHELRTPLTALRSVGEVALGDDGDPRACRDVIGSMLEETNRLTSLVETLLTLTRAEMGQINVERLPLDLGQLTAAVAEDLEVLAEERGQAFRIDCPGPVVVMADAATLRQALINLVDNAIKYTPRGGSIGLAVSAIDNLATVEVSDDGPGIAQEHHERLFDHFYRVDESRSSSTGGAGLGLAMARWAVTVNDGHLSLHSRPGEGCVFRIVLPILRD